MYAVSNEFLTAVQENTCIYCWSGTITTTKAHVIRVYASLRSALNECHWHSAPSDFVGIFATAPVGAKRVPLARSTLMTLDTAGTRIGLLTHPIR